MKVLEVMKSRTEFSLPIGDENMIAFAHWLSDREAPISVEQVRIVNSFIEWLLTTGNGSEALRLINDCPRQLFLPFDAEAPPWRWVDEDKGGQGDGSVGGAT